MQICEKQNGIPVITTNAVPEKPAIQDFSNYAKQIIEALEKKIATLNEQQLSMEWG